MPYLGDFLGLIMEEITKARVQADIETIRTADMYAQDDLLKNMPVPRFRLPDLTFEIPIAIEGIEKDVNFTQPGILLNFNRMLSIFLEVLIEKTKEGFLKELIQNNMERLKTSLSKKMESIKKQPDGSKDVKYIANELIAAAGKILTQLAREIKQLKKCKDEIEKILSDIRQHIYNVFNKLKPHPIKVPERVRIIVTTSKLKELAAISNLPHLVLKIHEEGMEALLEEAKDEETEADKETIEKGLHDMPSPASTKKTKFRLTPE